MNLRHWAGPSIFILALSAASAAQAGSRATMAPADNVTAQPAPNACISSAHPCVSVPVVFNRVNATPIRGYHISLTLSANLQLCGAGIQAATYLSSVNPLTHFEVTGTYPTFTVDEVILGSPCGATGTATIFTIPVSSTSPAATGTITINSVSVRDCNNDPVPGDPGDPASINIDNTNPTPIATLTAVRQNPSGHPLAKTTNVLVSWAAGEVEAGATVQVWRKGFGSYPEYSDPDGSGSVPAPPPTPALALAAGWTLTPLTAPGNDFTATRDYHYYVAYTTDACGNLSNNSNETTGTLNYFLGDFSDGFTAGVGNNKIFTEDISLLGAHYGITGAAVFPFSYLDVGPTTNHHADGRPTPDDAIDFEDLVITAINYDLVSKPSAIVPAVAGDALALSVDGLNARLLFQGSGRIQAISTQLRWNPAVVEPVSFSSGELLEQQGGVAFSGAAGSVDMALLGPNHGLRGEGALATLSFRRIASGDAGIDLARVDARDSQNERVDLGHGSAPAVQVSTRTGLRAAMPNPSRGVTSMEYTLARGGAVELSIYSVDGRKVATLVQAQQDVGVYRAVWKVMTSQGGPASPGVFFARLKTSQGTFSRMLTVVN